MIKLTIDDIFSQFKSGLFNRNYSVGVTEFCPYNFGKRIDIFYFSRWNRITMGYEIKMTRQDFLQDKKWPEYLKYCTRFYFAAPKGIIKLEELPPKIGLIEFEFKLTESWHSEPDDEKKYRLESDFTKKAIKLHDVEEKDYIAILEGLLMKLIYNKNLL
jgi:hypothetical protein